MKPEPAPADLHQIPDATVQHGYGPLWCPVTLPGTAEVSNSSLHHRNRPPGMRMTRKLMPAKIQAADENLAAQHHPSHLAGVSHRGRRSEAVNSATTLATAGHVGHSRNDQVDVGAGGAEVADAGSIGHLTGHGR